MNRAEFQKKTAFSVEFCTVLEKYGLESPEAEIPPPCFQISFFEHYAPKLGVPLPFASEIPELIRRIKQEKTLQIYANCILNAALQKGSWELGNWPGPHTLLSERQCGLYQLLIAMAALPRIEESYRKHGLSASFADGPAKWIGGTIALYAAAHNGNPGHDLRQITWLKNYIDNRLFRIGRFEYLIHPRPDWLPAVYRSRQTGRTEALCPEGWILKSDGFRAPRNEPIRKEWTIAHLEKSNHAVSGIPIHPAKGRAEIFRWETLPLTEYFPVFSAEEWVPSLHIPAGGGMKLELAGESLREAVSFFRTCFHREITGFCCESWILNPDWITELPDSNLTRLMREVYLFPIQETERAGLFFVYGRDDGDLSSYPADNSLRRAFRHLIDTDHPLREGGMFLLTADLPRFGTGTYRSIALQTS